jgi:hypothetical protein
VLGRSAMTFISRHRSRFAKVSRLPKLWRLRR